MEFDLSRRLANIKQSPYYRYLFKLATLDEQKLLEECLAANTFDRLSAGNKDLFNKCTKFNEIFKQQFNKVNSPEFLSFQQLQTIFEKV